MRFWMYGSTTFYLRWLVCQRESMKPTRVIQRHCTESIGLSFQKSVCCYASNTHTSCHVSPECCKHGCLPDRHIISVERKTILLISNAHTAVQRFRNMSENLVFKPFSLQFSLSIPPEQIVERCLLRKCFELQRNTLLLSIAVRQVRAIRSHC